MRTIEQIKQERTALLAEGEAILDDADAKNRALTNAEDARLKAITAQVEQMNVEISRRNLEAVGGPGSRGQPSGDVDDLDRDPPRGRIATFNSGAKLKAFADNREGHSSALRSGMWLRAALLGEAKALNWCQSNGVNVDIRAAHSAGDNAKGGVLVPEELSRTIIRLVEEFGVFRRNTRVVPMTSDTLNIPRRTGGLTAHYVGENTEGTESDTAWNNVSLVAKKLMILTRMSSEISEDAIISMADILAMEAALAFAEKEDNVGFIGTGSGADGGIVGVLVKALDAAHSNAKVTASGAGNSADVFAELTADHLLELMAAVPKFARRGAAWYCSPTAKSLVIDAIKMAGGGTTSQMLAERMSDSFLGYPVQESTVFPDDPAEDLSGKVMLAFGNLAQASTLGSRREMRFATTDSRYWEADQIGVKATMRHDINVHDLGDDDERKSPFCVLVGN